MGSENKKLIPPTQSQGNWILFLFDFIHFLVCSVCFFFVLDLLLLLCYVSQFLFSVFLMYLYINNFFGNTGTKTTETIVKETTVCVDDITLQMFCENNNLNNIYNQLILKEPRQKTNF